MRSTWPGDVVPPRHNPFNGKKRSALDLTLAGSITHALAQSWPQRNANAVARTSRRTLGAECLRWRLCRSIAAGAVAVRARFELSLAVASAFFFWSNVLAAFSYLAAARLGTRFGLINTMVFTHIPSSICIILAAFSPDLTFALAVLLVRSALSQMDVPTRTSYVMAVVTSAERTAAASVTAVPRSLASAVSPALSGALLSTSLLGLPLIICGTLKIVYDFALLFSFRHIKPPEETLPP